MTESICYLVLGAGLTGMMTLVIVDSAKIGIVSALHCALLSMMAYQGLSCLGFAYAGILLSFTTINLSLLGGIIVITIVAMRTKTFSGAERFSVFFKSFDSAEIQVLAASYLAAAAAGFVFFSIDLIPSSMTGDPARHFQLLIDLAFPQPAYANKPIYYLWAGAFGNLHLSLARDQLFVVFNMFVLGLMVSSTSLLMIKILGQPKWRDILLFVVLVAFGFPFFALQYGYYTLLLSATFLFSALALLLDYIKTGSTLIYALVTLLGCGVILTHSYFAPDFFFVVFAAALWQSHQTGYCSCRQIVQHMPYWIFAGLIVILSNTFLQADSPIQSLGQIIQAGGFVTRDFSRNILAFTVFAIPYFVADDKSHRNQILLLFVACSAAFSIIMFALYVNGFCAPYYVNRNQLVLIPLLTIGIIGTLRRFELKTSKPAGFVRFALLLLVVVPYFYYRNSPLAMTNVQLLHLLRENSGFLYFVNAETASYSPLQFTARDRALLTSPEHDCFDKTPKKMAVLGTDHQVIWFGIYASLYPSLMIRNDNFWGQPGYLSNYEMWKNGKGDQYIAVVKHTNYTISHKHLLEIRASSELTCEGDSFAVYRKFSH